MLSLTVLLDKEQAFDENRKLLSQHT